MINIHRSPINNESPIRDRPINNWYLKGIFIAALLFTFTIRRAIVMGDEARANSNLGKITGIVSVLLWSVVGIMGRGIGFY